MTYEKSIFIISYKCSDGIKLSLSFKIFLQTFIDQNIPLPLYIDFFCPGHVDENCYLHPKVTWRYEQSLDWICILVIRFLKGMNNLSIYIDEYLCIPPFVIRFLEAMNNLLTLIYILMYSSVCNKVSLTPMMLWIKFDCNLPIGLRYSCLKVLVHGWTQGGTLDWVPSYYTKFHSQRNFIFWSHLLNM